MAERDFEQDGLFKEIDEELRHDKFAQVWKKYGNHMIAAVIVLIASVAGFQGWKSYDANQRAEQSTRFEFGIRAAAENRTSEAIQVMEALVEDGSAGYALLARLSKAGLLARNGGIAEAIEGYLEIAENSSVDQIYRDLALVLATLHEIDRGNAAQMTQRIEPLLRADNPWRHSAKEITALLARRMGDKTRAGKLFRELADDVTAPSGMRARAAELSAIIGS